MLLHSRALLESRRNSIYGLIFTLLFPLGGMAYAIYNWRDSWSKNLFWLSCIYMGAVQIFQEEGSILGVGGDGGRYVLYMIEMHNSNISISELAKTWYHSSTLDIYNSILSFIVSRFTDNGHILFTCYAIVYGYFYSRNIWYVLEKLPEKFNRKIWILILFLFLNLPIWSLYAVRMWTATQVYLYGALPYLLDNRKNKLIWCLLSLLFHHSFILPICIIIVFAVLHQRLRVNRLFITSLLICNVLTLSINSLNINSVNDLLMSILPDYYSGRIDTYINEDYEAFLTESATLLSWHTKFAEDVANFVTQILLVLAFFVLRKDKSCSYYLNLLSFTLLITIFANIADLMPNGWRFLKVARMFSYSLFVMVFANAIIKKGQVVINICLYLLLFPLLFYIRTGLGYYSVTLFCGNFISVFFIESNVTLISYIKEFFG